MEKGINVVHNESEEVRKECFTRLFVEMVNLMEQSRYTKNNLHSDLNKSIMKRI